MLTQLAYYRVTPRREQGTNAVLLDDVSTMAGIGMVYYLLFAQYVVTGLLWPQAVATHPYLCDYLLQAPVFVMIVLNFAYERPPAALRFWILVLLFRISFNLEQIAQAKCQGCNYPAAWDSTRP